MTDERADKEHARAEKEYRAQWIRDAARDLLMARERSGDPIRDNSGARIDGVNHAWWLAVGAWNLYVKERKP